MANWNDFRRQQIFIGGEWCDARSGKTFDVVDPATDATIGTVPDAGADETRFAIEAAERAFETFSMTTAAERADLLQRLSRELLANKDALAELLTREQGKPLAEARAEVGTSAAYIQWFAEEARRVYGDTVPSPWHDRRLLVTKSPVGVVGAITPWNFPCSMLARKLGPALAAGCTVVAKPASQTPYSALALALLAQRVGFPPGTVNVLTGSASTIVGTMMASKEMRKISFTGSTAVGKTLLRQAADTVKKVSMELGGNAPFIVFDDADVDRAAEGAVAAKFRNAGQTCVCANRIFVHAGIHDRFVEVFVRAVQKLKVGSGLETGTMQGPLIDLNALEKVEQFIADACAKGGRVVAGGRRHPKGGLFFEPTVVADASTEMHFSQEEIFGPVAPIFRFQTEEEAIALANGTDSGLASYFYTSDLGRAFRVSERLRFGIVGVNEGIITTEVAPFGGVKESGMGREGSRSGIEDYLDTKYVCIGGLGL